MTGAASLSTEEAVEYLGITVHALRMLLHRGHLRPTGRLGQRLLFSVDDLDEQVQQNLADKPICVANDDVEPAPTSTSTTTDARCRRRRPKKPTPVSSIRASLNADRKAR